ncbi:MAG TPA: PBP1A family penicillin-binding protein [Stellaceae bacterium]|nr:PBP1A family penicillin-binding protein [Stellaceae bacterium]
MAARRNGDLRAEPEERGFDPPPRRRRNGKRAGGGNWRGRIGKALLLCLLWLAIIGGGVLGYYALTLPSTKDIAVADRRPSVTLLAADGTLVATFGDLFGEPIRLKDMPKYLPEAVIATEDRRFYHHFGIDLIGLVRAAVVNLRAGHVVQGGSTLTQQLAKNLFLSPDRTMTRKIQEALLAVWLEQRFTKNEILEIYLNRVYLGAGAYGVDAAAHRYFDKPARQVTLYEAATIAGLLKAPTRYSPARDQSAAAERARHVLDAMKDAGYITMALEKAAFNQQRQNAGATHARPSDRYFADWIYEQIPEFAGLGNRDLVIATTLDARMQQEAEAAIETTLDRDGAKDDVGQGALVAMTPDGAIRAMVGGRSYNGSQFNRATQALRQPGSAFKAIVYAAALERGLSPYQHFDDHRIRIGNWEPRNFENEYRGDVSVADAVAFSINTVAAQVIEHTGVSHVIDVARRLGITTDLQRDASLALGTNEVTLIELTSAYAAFASGGVGTWPYGILEIKDRDGNIVYRRGGSGPGRVLPTGIAGTMNQLLAGVIERGTGRAARLDRPAAGKTGTTQDFRDALFIGYTAQLVTGVWFGNDDNAPMKHITGGTLPAQTWHNFMMAATRGEPIKPLPGPPPGYAPRAPLVAGPAPQQPQLASGTPAAQGGLDGLLDRIFGSGRSGPDPHAAGNYYVPPTRYH